MADETRLTLDYDAAREIVYSASRRAMAFMGFALNAAKRDDVNDFSLNVAPKIKVLPDGYTADDIAAYKKEFEQWIVTNGLRELIEGLSLFLDQIYELSLLASKHGKALGSDFHGKLAAFKNKGLPGKQKLLKDEFNITSEHAAAFRSIYETRNCLSHTKGIVTQKFCNNESADRLVIEWNAIEHFITRPDKPEFILDGTPEPPPYDKPGVISKRVITRRTAFHIGDVISFSPKDLGELCIFVHLGCQTFYLAAHAYADSQGITT